ncbi:MAG: DUF3006 domain-containing protein [Gemmatimonadaceae bacterium]
MADSSSGQAGITSTWVVDQIENGVATMEVAGETTITVPTGILPRGVSEGDVLRVTIMQDPAELARRLAQSAAQIAKGGKGGKGNIAL